jgi:type VI secretion system protein ImpD
MTHASPPHTSNVAQTVTLQHKAAESVSSLLSAVVSNTSEASHALHAFLSAPNAEQALRTWIQTHFQNDAPKTKRALQDHLHYTVARIDEMLTAQVNAILHHPRFQKLEASWRGLRYLTEQVDEHDADNRIKIKFLDVNWRTLARDLDKAIEFDQSEAFRKIYNEEFDTPGGEPYGVLLGDYYVTHKAVPGQTTNDIATLSAMSQVAAAAFAPFITAADPSLFGLDDYSELGAPLNLTTTFEQTEYIKWHALRDQDDARFLGITAPQTLMRTPYEDDGTRRDGFQFHEHVSGNIQNYLWGNAAYAFGGVLIRSYAQNGWFAEIRGQQRNIIGGGLVTGLPFEPYPTDKHAAHKPSLNVMIGDKLEREMTDLGFIPLCSARETDFSVFYSNASVQKPKVYDRLPATVNAKLSSMLQYMLCVSRFAHYLKIIGRDKMGVFANPDQLQNYLHRWLLNYSTSDDHLSNDMRAQYPLREAKVELFERPDKPGNFGCVIHLQPHFQLDQLSSSVRLVTELAPTKSSV